MERKVTSLVSGVVLIITIASCFLLMYFPNLHTMAMNKQTEYELSAKSHNSILNYIRNDSSNSTWAYDASMRLELPDGISSDDIIYEVKPYDRLIEISIPKAGKDYFEEYPILGQDNNIQDITYEWDGSKGIIDIKFNDIYEYLATAESKYVYLGFVKPRDKYNKIIVIDAGHGGNVPGATRFGFEEKDIDLAIAQDLYDMLAKEESVGVYMTRSDDTNPSFSDRVALANDIKADYFISIHNNAMTTNINNNVYGTEVLYKSKGTKKVTASSKAFAKACLSSVASNFDTKSIGIKKGDDLYLLHYSKVPTVLVEVGFLTDQEELLKLADASWQKKAAKGIYQAVMDAD